MKEKVIKQILNNQLTILNTLSNMADPVKGRIDKDNLYNCFNESEKLLRELRDHTPQTKQDECFGKGNGNRFPINPNSSPDELPITPSLKDKTGETNTPLTAQQIVDYIQKRIQERQREKAK